MQYVLYRPSQFKLSITVLYAFSDKKIKRIMTTADVKSTKQGWISVSAEMMKAAESLLAKEFETKVAITAKEKRCTLIGIHLLKIQSRLTL